MKMEMLSEGWCSMVYEYYCTDTMSAVLHTEYCGLLSNEKQSR